MTETQAYRIPEEIKLDSKSRVLRLGYANGTHFDLPCEYLRVYSPSVEVSGLGELQVYKEDVNITDIKPIGSYAVRLFFDDGHKTGIYTWEYLYELGVNHAENWRDYLDRVKASGYPRKASDTIRPDAGTRR